MNASVPTRANADVLEENYALWREDAGSVTPTWSAFFEGFELGVAQPGQAAASGVGSGSASGGEDLEFIRKVAGLIEDYRALGHTQAHINPLAEESPPGNPRLAIKALNFSQADLARVTSHPSLHQGQSMPLGELLNSLTATYCGSIGFEFMHISDTAVREWLRERIEARVSEPPESPARQADALRWLLEAEVFEQFIGRKFLGEKRFSLEGGEGAMIVLNAILESCPASGVAEIEMGMSHRGRLNVLANFLRKTLTTILLEFTPNFEPDVVAGDGDVKYHLGYENFRELADGKVRVNLAANPSHLEAVNSIVEGKTRARQRILGDDATGTNRKRVLPLLIHGDAAFAGQGSVAELLNLSQLPGYRTGGTLHLIINNQIGFTTDPADARSSAYATDVAKMIEAPILHVNGEDPLALHWAGRCALEFRQRFGRDMVIDLLCYRRQGHNEADQAAFTQPLVAKKIAVRETLGQLYKRQLVGRGVLESEEADAIEQTIWDKLEAGYQKMTELSNGGERTAFTGSTAIVQPAYSHAPVATGISRERLHHLGKALTTLPADFHLNATLAKRFLPRRVETLQQGGPFDWAFAESLAFGSLLMEQTPVRLSGQDSRRGTFSQRHAVFYDAETHASYIPLEHLDPGQARFCIYNSLLSEFAVLGFDYGYSLGYPAMLTLWEAQFGDFANGAQVIIDQFITSAESKWQTPSDIVLMLPHGYEGMGPEHSSARLERFLQLCAADNLVVGNFTTPAQFFHALRRQKLRNCRKPLIVMTPKSLLTRQEAVSQEADFLEGTCFQEILPDSHAHEDPAAVERVIFCSGKVFYDLCGQRQQSASASATTAILRLEQLYPFHRELLETLLSHYPAASQFVWCQEEPANMGAWTYVAPLLEAVVGTRVRYAGRPAAASPASGSKAIHIREQQALLALAFSI
ncbi:MAG: 2-oxoglutarate dehydrogenase E1 component [Verrucomicrobia bacterium]|nr:MAG: 2-oxoglutarate dehydrogenase E1 component [Verrucomicrobiota bacterium]